MRGQFLCSRKNAYGNQTLQLSIVNTGISNDPGWPERLRRIWSKYEKYVSMAVDVAIHPIMPTVFWFIPSTSLRLEESCYLIRYSGRHIGKGPDTRDLISLECKDIHCLKF